MWIVVNTYLFVIIYDFIYYSGFKYIIQKYSSIITIMYVESTYFLGSCGRQ